MRHKHGLTLSFPLHDFSPYEFEGVPKRSVYCLKRLFHGVNGFSRIHVVGAHGHSVWL